jgi:hypothetical protein
MLSADFEKHGATVIEEVRRRKPEIYLASVVSLLPRQTRVETLSPLNELSDEEVQMLEEHLTACRAKLVRELDEHAGNGAAAVAPPIAVEPQVLRDDPADDHSK